MSQKESTCIYCLRLLPKGQFDREHVMPQHLGSFQSNFVLRNTVCRDCNKSLGDQLELWLGRDSFEGLQRLRFGLKPGSELKNFWGRGVKLRLPPGSDWEGAIVVLHTDPKTGELVVDLTPQIGVKTPNDKEFHYFKPDDFMKASDAEVGTEKGSDFKIIGLGQIGSEAMIELVRKRVSALTIHGALPQLEQRAGEASIAVVAKIDELLARAIAKIAFSYMTFFSESRFALDEAFDEIRRFIRYGDGIWRDFVKVSTRPVLANDAIIYGSTRGHLVTVDWPGRSEIIVSNVSLFNEIAYVVTLARRCRALWRPLQFGNLFDWETRKIIKLTTGSGLSLPWQMFRP